MRKIAPALVLSFLTAAALQLTAAASNWAQWRGPQFNGSSDESGLPSSWSKTENIAWAAALPGPSAATPIVHGDHVFVSSTDLKSRSLQALCLNRKTGQIQWQHEVGPGFRRDDRSNYASPSPAADGERVVFFYGNGDLLAFDFSGKKLWSRNIEKDYGAFAFQWTFSTSPLLHNGKLYLQVLQRDVPVNGRGRANGPNPSYLLAIDPATGQTLWKHLRPSDARAESLEAFTTPIPFEFNGRKEILIAGGDCLTGHHPDTGAELWRWGTWNPARIGHWRLVPSPVAGNGIILACAPKTDPIYAIKAGGTGVLDDSAIAWTSAGNRHISSDVPTPLFYQDDFFILNEGRSSLSRVEPKSGEVKWTAELSKTSRKFESSPLGADGKIYAISFKGDVVVVDAANGKILNLIPMGEEDDDNIRSSIAASQGHLFIRTNSKLFCVGKNN